MSFSRVSFIFILVLQGFIAVAQPVRNTLNARVSKVVNQYLKPGDPGVAVGILQNGEEVARYVSGLSSLDFHIAVSSSTRFNIASNAKQFTAACILLLAEERKLALDDDFRRYLPGILPAYPQPITILTLLNHTSGIRDVYDLWNLQGKTWWQLMLTNEDALQLLGQQTSLNFSPGSGYLYSNSNYLLLAEIVQKVSGTSLKEYAAARIFTPLGMTGTGFSDNYMDPIPNRATAYGNFDGWKAYPWLSSIYGDGGLFTTLDDQLRWEKHLQHPVLWSKELVRKLLAPQASGPFKEYGFGMMFDRYNGFLRIYHDGSTGAYNASFDRFPAESISVIVMSNNSKIPTRRISQELAELVLPKANITPDNFMPEEPAGAAVDPDISGDYQFSDGRLIKIRQDSLGFYREIYGRDPGRLVKVNNVVYAYRDVAGLRIHFAAVGKEVSKLTIYAPFQPQSTAVKLPLEKKSDPGVSFDGTYLNAETGSVIHVKNNRGGDFEIVGNGKVAKGELVRNGLIFTSDYQLKFNIDETGKIPTMKLSGGRIANVEFVRQSLK